MEYIIDIHITSLYNFYNNYKLRIEVPYINIYLFTCSAKGLLIYAEEKQVAAYVNN